MSAQQQPSWNTAAAAAYYAYATQAANSAPPAAASVVPGTNAVDSTTAQVAAKISQLWDSLPETQRSYYLAALQNYRPLPSSEADRLGLAKLMAYQHYEQYQAQQQGLQYPAANASAAAAMYQQQLQQQQQQLQQQQLQQQQAYQTHAQARSQSASSISAVHQQQHGHHQTPSFTSKRAKSPTRAPKRSTNSPTSAPWRSSSASNSPNVHSRAAHARPNTQDGFTEIKADRKTQMGDFVREMLTLLKGSPPAIAEYVKEKLKPLGQTFLHDPKSPPLPSVRAFVTGAIAEYKRQHLITNPPSSTQPHPHDHSRADSSSPSATASEVYGPTRPNTHKSGSSSTSAATGHKATGALLYAAAASSSSALASPLATSNNKKRKNAAMFNPDTNFSSSSLPASSSSTYSFTSTGSLDPEELKKREREQRFRSAEQRLAAERAAAQAMARANLAHYQEVHRAARTAAANGGLGYGDDGGAMDDPENEHGDLDDVVVGTSQALEKPFLRLTSAPDPAEVRPLPVLEKAIVHLMNRWKEARDYRFMCDQLKSVRQDLLVQRIQNELTVKVYELHARIALEMGDFSEFNQCQTQLKILYERGVAGCHAEFLAYRILYFLYTKSRRDMKLLLSSLTPSDRANHYVSQALAVRAAAQRGDYLTFFHLYRIADLLMGTYLLDPMMDRERVKGLWTMTKSHMTVRMDRIVTQLAWDDTHQARMFINRVVDQVCDARCVQPVPKDRSEYKVQEGAEVVEGKKIRVMMEAWLVAFTKVDIKGQLD